MRTFWRNKVVEGGCRSGQILRSALIKLNKIIRDDSYVQCDIYVVIMYTCGDESTAPTDMYNNYIIIIIVLFSRQSCHKCTSSIV